ncbi:MAG: serine/threonine protein kinase [Planctomycetota bacterium]|jgi:predicted Ser/Thr protein kinase
MARRRKKRSTPKKKAPPEPKKRKPTEPAELGTETSADTSLVNALESDPGFFKDPLIGQTLGKCVINGLIGEGRTSVVYEATYKPLKRTVAVKVLQAEMTKYPAVVRVFQQEGRAVAALDHENVVKIYDVGEDQKLHYLVLERLRGQDVLKHIEQSDGIRLPVAEALDFTRQAAAGLAAAHRKNLIHRDIKPQNLVIEPDGTLKIVDFGLAAEAEGAFAGGRLGTPHYMSPEVCRGEMAGTAADIYGLGVTFFHMLVGHAPYAGRKTTDEIVEGHLSAERFYPEKIRPDIPKPVADLVRRMTRMDAANRPSAKEVVELISEKLTPEKLGARHKVRGAGRGRRARAKRAPGPTYMIVGAVALAVVLGAFLMGGDEGTPESEPKANLPQAPPPPTPTPDPPKPTKKYKEITDKALAKDLRELMAQAKQEEKTGNLQEAHYLYTRVLVKAPADSRYADEARAAAVAVEERLTAEVGIKRAPRKWISVRDSEKAGQDFAKREKEFWTRLGNFEIQTVKDETDKLLRKTRTGSAERAAIEFAVAKMRYIESLLSILQTRADSLSGADARWNNFDYEAGEGLLVMAADETGVTLKDQDMGTNRMLPWREIPIQVRIAFLETLRNPKSATETLWLGAYCKLVGDAAAEQYFDYALMLDSGPDMKAQIKALKGN